MSNLFGKLADQFKKSNEIRNLQTYFSQTLYFQSRKTQNQGYKFSNPMSKLQHRYTLKKYNCFIKQQKGNC